MKATNDGQIQLGYTGSHGGVGHRGACLQKHIKRDVLVAIEVLCLVVQLHRDVEHLGDPGFNDKIR